MNKKQIIAIIFSIIFIIAGIAMNNKTEYAKITGESFTIPKIEGTGYFERGEDL